MFSLATVTTAILHVTSPPGSYPGSLRLRYQEEKEKKRAMKILEYLLQFYWLQRDCYQMGRQAWAGSNATIDTPMISCTRTPWHPLHLFVLMGRRIWKDLPRDPST